MYVEQLIGPDTVDTLPPETLDAFLYHGEARRSLETDADLAKRDLEALKGLGIDLAAITQELEIEGVTSFRESWNKLLAALKEKCFKVSKDFAGQ
jgi:transaldolase